tara:strand:- start:281 stop:529 length:249 start_codon:yes stop_codon:yes gene_type:complete
MAKVVIPIDVAKVFSNGEAEHFVRGDNLRTLLKNLDSSHPGMKGRLESGFAVAIDGQIYQDWFIEEINPDSEVHFIPAVEGG